MQCDLPSGCCHVIVYPAYKISYYSFDDVTLKSKVIANKAAIPWRCWWLWWCWVPPTGLRWFIPLMSNLLGGVCLDMLVSLSHQQMDLGKTRALPSVGYEPWHPTTEFWDVT